MKGLFQSKIFWLAVFNFALAILSGLTHKTFAPGTAEEIVALDWTNVGAAIVSLLMIVSRAWFTSKPIKGLIASVFLGLLLATTPQTGVAAPAVATKAKSNIVLGCTSGSDFGVGYVGLAYSSNAPCAEYMSQANILPPVAYSDLFNCAVHFEAAQVFRWYQSQNLECSGQPPDCANSGQTLERNMKKLPVFCRC